MKNINDELGHKAGDQALIDTANILTNTFRETDIIARIGGNEFAVLLTEHSRTDIDEIIINHIKTNQRTHNEEAVRKYELLFSMGIVHHDPKHLCTIDRLLTQADKLMYKDKVNNKIEQQVTSSLKKYKTERRVYKRVRTEDKCWAEFNDSEKIRLYDISMGGVCLETVHYLPINSTHKIRITSNRKEEIHSTGLVVWSNGIEKKNNSLVYHKTGINFMHINDRLKGSLGQFIINITN